MPGLRISGLWFLLSLTLWSLLSCSQDDNFPEIQSNLSGPVDVASLTTQDQTSYFYALNSDFEWKFDTGSIVVLSEDGDKLGYVLTPRLGRAMEIDQVNGRLLVAFDIQEEDGEGSVHYYDVKTDPKKPELKQSWSIPCTPLGLALSPLQEYFFVSCVNGDLYLGSFKEGGEPFHRVRAYGFARRAMYYDGVDNLLYGFPTDLGAQTSSDLRAFDKESYSKDGELTVKPNEIPDIYENTKKARQRISNRYVYQFYVYDVNADKANGFKERFVNVANDPTADHELRWAYFNLESSEGHPDDDGSGVSGRDIKFYHTNFTHAEPDIQGSSELPNHKVFYLSHRGLSYSANNVIKVTRTFDPRPIAPNADNTCPDKYRFESGKCIRLTEHTFKFERVYGFSGEVDSLHYPGDFVIRNIKSQNTLVVNHFRDLVNFSPAKRRFSIATKVLGDLTSRKEEFSHDHRDSYYGVAVLPNGRGITCSFYGGHLVLFDVIPGVEVKIVESID